MSHCQLECMCAAFWIVQLLAFHWRHQWTQAAQLTPALYWRGIPTRRSKDALFLDLSHEGVGQLEGQTRIHSRTVHVTCLEAPPNCQLEFLTPFVRYSIHIPHSCCPIFGSARQPRTLGVHCYFNTCHMMISHRRPPGRCATSRTRLVWPHIIRGLTAVMEDMGYTQGLCSKANISVLASCSLGLVYLNQNRASDKGQIFRATSDRQILFFVNTRCLA